MKKILYTMVLILTSVLFNTKALAQIGIGIGGDTNVSTADNRASASNSQNQNQDQGQRQNQGQDQQQSANNGGVTFGGVGSGSGFGNNNSTNSARGSDLSEAVGTAIAPALTTTLTETCMGSTSVGAGFSGGSFSFGTTWRDSACVRRLDARQVQSMGDVQAAKEVMCDSDLVRQAFKNVGRPCSSDGGTYTAVSRSEPTAAPVAVIAPTTAEVTDDQDIRAQKDSQVLLKADKAREEMKTKYGF